MYPYSTQGRCPVRFIDKYMSLLPPVKNKNAKHNFYLHSLDHQIPAQWYSTQMVLNTLNKTIWELAKSASLKGFFNNHSLYRSSATQLCQAGVPKKIIKEITGH